MFFSIWFLYFMRFFSRELGAKMLYWMLVHDLLSHYFYKSRFGSRYYTTIKLVLDTNTCSNKVTTFDCLVYNLRTKQFLPGLRVRLWIRVCHTFARSGNRRTFAYGSAVPLKSCGCKSCALKQLHLFEIQDWVFNNKIHYINKHTSTNRTDNMPALTS